MVKSNRNIRIIKEKEKSYVYVYDGKRFVGSLMWDFSKKKWRFRA